MLLFIHAKKPYDSFILNSFFTKTDIHVTSYSICDAIIIYASLLNVIRG